MKMVTELSTPQRISKTLSADISGCSSLVKEAA